MEQDMDQEEGLEQDRYIAEVPVVAQ